MAEGRPTVPNCVPAGTRSITGNHDDCDNQERRDQRKRAIDFFRPVRGANGVEWSHASNSLNSAASRPAAFGQQQPATVRDAAKQASLFERLGSLRARRHPARFLKGIHRHRIPGTAGWRSFFLHDSITSCRGLPKLVSARFHQASRFHASGGSVTELSVTENCPQLERR
jgi:hypothetical protein